MAKTPNVGPGGPLEATQGAPEGEGAQQAAERRGGAGQGANTRASAEAPASDNATRTRAPGGRIVGERKQQFLIAPRAAPGGLHALGFQPLQLSSVEQALRASPDIEVIDKVGPRDVVGMMADGMGGGQGVLVARMTAQKAGALHQQAQGRLVVERDQHLTLMDAQAFMRPAFVSNVVPTSGAAFTAMVRVLDKDGAPVPEAEVSLFGSLLPATGSTDASGEVSLSLFGETASSIRGLYIKPKYDYWSYYSRDPDLSADEANVVVVRALADWPSLAGFPRQKAFGWGQKAMRLDQLPDNLRGQGIRVAVIDSGVATTHEGLSRVRAGFDIINKKTNPNTWNEDTLGHGSHCAGMIGAADLAFGVRGFAPECEIHACKLFPGGQVSQLIDALEYCIEKQIDVVNLSLGGAEVSEALEQQIQRAKRAGIACIVAAGNSGGAVQYPASSPNVLAVAAVGKLDEFPPDSYHAQTLSQNVDATGYFTASFSCFGPQVAVCAPGVAIASTVPPNNYAAWDGTSMAAPHVTGLAALVLAHHPDFQGPYQARTAQRVERLFQQIRLSARRVSLGDHTRVGLGLPDAVIAVGLQQPQWSQPGVAQPARGALGDLMGQAMLHGALGGLMAQAPIGRMGQMGQMDQFGFDHGMGAYTGFVPGGVLHQFGILPGLPFGIVTSGFRGW